MTGCGGDRRPSAFERRDPLLERGNGGVGDPRIDVAERLQVEQAAAWSTSSNTYDVVWWIGTFRDPVTGSGRAPAWTARVSNP